MGKMRSEVILDGDSKGYIAAIEKSKQANAKMKADYEKKIAAMKQSGDSLKANIKTISAGFLAAGSVITAALALAKQGMEATGGGADKLVEITSTLKGGFQEFARAVTQLDFRNFIQGIRDAAVASQEWAQAQDRVNTRISDFQLLNSKIQGRVAELRSKKALGTINPEESKELIAKLRQQQVYEEAIYNDALQSMREYINTKTGLDAELFNRLEKGIEERAALGDVDLEYINANYKAKEAELKKQFKDISIWMTGPTGMPQQIKVASQEFNAAMGQWIGTLSGPELAQLTEDTFLDPAKWNQLIGYYVKRNELTSQYAAQETKAARAGGLGSAGKSNTGHGIEGLISMAGGAAGSPSLSQIDGFNKLSTATQEATASLVDYQNISMMLESSFASMFSSGIEGWEEFGRAALDAIKSIIIKLAALAATYLVLSMIPGFAEFLTLMGGFRGFMTQGMGLGTVPVKAGGGGMAVLKGRDIVYSSARSSNSLGGLT